MLQFVLTYLALFSFGVLLVLIVRSWPRIKDQTSATQSRVGQWVLSDIPLAVDRFLLRWTEKFFRRLKIMTLRIDNYLTDRLKMMSLETKEKPKIDFKEIEHAEEMTGPKEGN